MGYLILTCSGLSGVRLGQTVNIGPLFPNYTFHCVSLHEDLNTAKVSRIVVNYQLKIIKLSVLQ